jgi:hypothetical protein
VRDVRVRFRVRGAARAGSGSRGGEEPSCGKPSCEKAEERKSNSRRKFFPSTQMKAQTKLRGRCSASFKAFSGHEENQESEADGGTLVKRVCRCGQGSIGSSETTTEFPKTASYGLQLAYGYRSFRRAKDNRSGPRKIPVVINLSDDEEEEDNGLFLSPYSARVNVESTVPDSSKSTAEEIRTKRFAHFGRRTDPNTGSGRTCTEAIVLD